MEELYEKAKELSHQCPRHIHTRSAVLNLWVVTPLPTTIRKHRYLQILQFLTVNYTSEVEME